MNGDSAQVNVGILHYKTKDKTELCVDSILKTMPSSRICIIDNFSNDGSLECLQSKYQNNDSIEFLCLSQNGGFAKGNNEYLKLMHTRGVKYAILTNNDIQFKNNAIKCLIKSLEETGAFIASPKVYGVSGEICDSVQMTISKSFISFLLNKKRKNPRPFVAEKLTQTSRIEKFSGCCFACDIELMNKVGYLDQNTFLYYEEAILSYKALEKGWNIVYCPFSEVVHFHASSTKHLDYMVDYYMLQSELYYLQNYIGVSNVALQCYLFLKKGLFKMRKYPETVIKASNELQITKK